MQTIILTCGVPSSGKSTWAKEQVTLDPEGTVRINRDDLRNSLSNYHYSKSNEKLVSDIRESAIVHALKSGRNVILDDTNLVPKNFTDTCKLVQKLNIDVTVTEKSFYVELDEAIRRDNLRTGSAHVGADVIRKFWKKSGGELHQHYKVRTEVFYKRATVGEKLVSPMIQDPNLPKCVIADLDGTCCNISHRNPYDASNCDKDTPNDHVIDLIKLLYTNGYKIMFFSGREDKHKELTIGWLNKYFGTDYELHMRESGNFEDDAKLKERFFNSYVKDKLNCKLWLDDRLRVCKFVYSVGLPLARIGDPEASF